jgi:hypothetical protein
MLVSIVGHAIFQTAGRSGPSTIDRSYRRVGAGAGGSGTAVVVASLEVVDVLVKGISGRGVWQVKR